MERADYEKTLSRIETRNMNKVIDFFLSLPYFVHWSRTAISKLKFQFDKVDYKRN